MQLFGELTGIQAAIRQIQSLTKGIAGAEVQVAPHTEYAFWVEFGTSKMEAREYMRKGFEKSRASAIEYARKKLSEKASMKSALTGAGKLIETACKEECPVDTGRLRASITTEVVGEGGGSEGGEEGGEE